ncbi:hypothetical protein QN277_005488 [Acacia crassicarpa]|uniref:Scarecrow-like protein 13 n=1 Tax=Acacia crassicarpa TaxID=499986 RepID=A0AAE1MGF9_9FABA|nr:hypothetical protein QN277_005488 [Acacia crassicarpa]
MQTSQKHPSSVGFHLYHQPMLDTDTYHLSRFQILPSNSYNEIVDDNSQGTTVSFENCNQQYFTLESSLPPPPPPPGPIACDSSSFASNSSNRSPFSPQGSQTQSSLSDQHQSLDNTYGSPISGCSSVDGGNEWKHWLKELEHELLGPEPDIVDSRDFCPEVGQQQASAVSGWNWDQIVEMIPKLDLKDVLIRCAQAVSDDDFQTAAGLMDKVLVKMVSVSGDPLQRLGAYMLEGLRAKVGSTGSTIYKSLKCEQEQPPTSKELMNYMGILYRICPYWPFAYTSANAVILEAMQNESRIHIIDFQIAQGTQWKLLIRDLAQRPGGAPYIRVTGVDDSQSFHARGGGLHIVGQNLANHAKSLGVPFEFHSAAMSGCEVQLENLGVRPGEAVAVNFPYVLHHMPDESVSTENHRDRLLRLVKSLSPKVMTLVEQESNTNTSPFLPRFIETLNYYTAMFESIDAGSSNREDKERISAEQHCVARDIVNMIACEGRERVERHELLRKWMSRLAMAGFKQYPLSAPTTAAVRNLLKGFKDKYRLECRDGALYLSWMSRDMSTSSAWW